MMNSWKIMICGRSQKKGKMMNKKLWGGGQERLRIRIRKRWKEGGRAGRGGRGKVKIHKKTKTRIKTRTRTKIIIKREIQSIFSVEDYNIAIRRRNSIRVFYFNVIVNPF